MEAQVQVLGAMLIDPEAVGGTLLSLSDAEFTEPRYRLIFQAFRRLYNAKKPTDPLSVNDALGGNYNKILAEIMEVTVTSANVEAHAAIVRKTALQMRLAELGRQLSETMDYEEQLTIRDQITALACGKPGVKITTMRQAYEEFLDRHGEEQQPPYLTWGIPALNEQIHVEAGDMIVLGGYPSAGKTALALQFCRHIAKDKRVGYFYLENNDRKLEDRMVSAVTLVDFGKIKTYDLEEADFENIVSMQGALISPQLEYIDASGMTVADIRSVALAKRYEVIVVDYLQKIRGDRSRRNLSDFERVSQISSDLQELGRQTGVTVLALSQLSRPEKRKNGSTPAPSMSSLRQSGQLEQDADVIMLVYLEDETNERLRTLKLAKNKEGHANIAMRMVFEGKNQTFSRVSPQSPPGGKPKDKKRQLDFWGWTEIKGDDGVFEEGDNDTGRQD